MSIIDVYAITDAEESDPDPIYCGDRVGLTDVLGDVTLDLLFHDDDMNHDVFDVRNADGVVIAVAYAG